MKNPTLMKHASQYASWAYSMAGLMPWCLLFLSLWGSNGQASELWDKKNQNQSGCPLFFLFYHVLQTYVSE